MPEKCILNPSNDCLGLIRAEELAKNIQALEHNMEATRDHNEKSHKEFYDRLSLLEAHNKVQDVHYEHIIEKLNTITNELTSLSSRIASIESKPAKRWESVIEKIISLFIAAFFGYMFSKTSLQ